MLTANPVCVYMEASSTKLNGAYSEMGGTEAVPESKFQLH